MRRPDDVVNRPLIARSGAEFGRIPNPRLGSGSGYLIRGGVRGQGFKVRVGNLEDISFTSQYTSVPFNVYL